MTSATPLDDLEKASRRLFWLLLLPVGLTVRGLVHGLDSVAMLSDLPFTQSLASLPGDWQRILVNDGRLRLAQISATFVFLTYFCFGWLPVAFGNLSLMQGDAPDHRSLRAMVARNLLTATRVLRKLFSDSAHPDHAHLTLRFSVPACTTALIAANVCKIMAVVLMTRAVSVGDWIGAERWMLAGYGSYLVLFSLALRVTGRLEFLQRNAWARAPRTQPSPS